jgi:hypothetical protein
VEKLLNRSDPERLDPERLRAAEIGLTPSGWKFFVEKLLNRSDPERLARAAREE